MLTPQQFKFVVRYVEHGHGTKAAIEAGYAKDSAAVASSRNLADSKIKAAIEEHKENIALQASITPAAVLKRWWQIANADPSELVANHQVNCRHCNGIGHMYQWTPGEFVDAIEKARATKTPPPDPIGGLDFKINGDPHPGCPECGGNGVMQVIIADNRKLKGSAKLLYAGIQQTRDGFKILMRDQDGALANIAKFLGMFVDRKEVTGPGGQPIAIAHIRPEDLTDEQLAAVIHTTVDDESPNES